MPEFILYCYHFLHKKIKEIFYNVLIIGVHHHYSQNLPQVAKGLSPCKSIWNATEEDIPSENKKKIDYELGEWGCGMCACLCAYTVNVMPFKMRNR